MVLRKWWWGLGVVALLSVLTAQVVRADGLSYFTNINDLYYAQKIINDCVYEARPAAISPDTIDKPWLWLNGKSLVIGRYTAPASGTADCGNEAVMSKAYSTFLSYNGYANSEAFITALGYQRITGNSGPPTNQVIDEYQLKSLNMGAIQDKTPPQTSTARYFALNTVFTSQCITSGAGQTIQRQTVVEEPAGSKTYITKAAPVTIRTSSYTTTTGSGVSPLTVTNYDYHQSSINCQQLSSLLDGLVGAVVDFNNSNPDNAITTPMTAGISGDTTGSSASTCTIEGLGWIICPVVNFLANLVDFSYGIVSSLLEFHGFTSTENGTLKEAWSLMRNFANICFVIGFLVIVFSQVTSIGISNYGIKKLLPKLIITAILVNLSYILCALAVDASNVLGSSIKAFFDGLKLAGDVKPESIGSTGGGWLGIGGAILAGGITVGVTLYVGLSALLPALIAAAASIVTALLVLTLRQALIILLIVIAPLAFVALLLPNTEGLFKKWRQLFTTLLLMYPIISFLFGASKLASLIITSSASGPAKIPIQIMGALVAVLPLAITPILMKISGGLLNRFGGIVNNTNRGPFDRMRKGAERIQKDQEGKRAIRALKGGLVVGAGRFKRASRRDAVSQGIQREQKRTQSEYIANQVKGNDAFANRTAGGSSSRYLQADPDALQRAQRDAQYTIEQVEAEEVKAASVELRGVEVKAIVNRALTGNDEDGHQLTSAQHMAAVDIAMAKGGFNDRKSLAEASSGFDSSIRQRISDGLYAKGDQGIYGVGIGDKILSGSINKDTLRQETHDNIADGNVDGSHLVHSQGATKYMVNVAMGLDDDSSTPYTGSSVGRDPAVQDILKRAITDAKTGEQTKIAASGDGYEKHYSRLP